MILLHRFLKLVVEWVDIKNVKLRTISSLLVQGLDTWPDGGGVVTGDTGEMEMLWSGVLCLSLEPWF